MSSFSISTWVSLTPIFMLTLSKTDDAVAYGGSLDGYDFSANPVRIEELVRCLDEMLQA